MTDNPNILFIQVDQLTAFALKAYGDEVCHSPNLDNLAENGVVFENAYCNFPLCAPSRFSMATGQLCSKVGAYDNGAEFPASIPSYAHYLRASGYQTSLSGKMHFIGPDQFHGFEKRLTADLYPADFAWLANWDGEGKRDTNDERGILTAGVCERSVQLDFDNEVTHCAVQNVYDMARSDDRRPFFMQVSYTHPHDPFLCEQKYWDLYEDKEIPLPRVGYMEEDQHDKHSLRILAEFGLVGKKFDDNDVLRARRGYYGSVSYIDAQIGELLSALKATGYDQNTVIVFTSDHGEMLGEKGLWFKKTLHEPALRVPLFIYAPWIGGQRVSEGVSLVDLLPTFCSFANIELTADCVEQLEGMDLCKLIDKGDPEPGRSVYVEYLAESTSAPIFVIRKGRYKFIHSIADGCRLYDLTNDPDELVNLIEDQAHQDTVTGFRTEAQAKWDGQELGCRIRLSQKRRIMIRNAMKQGDEVRWNHGEQPYQHVRWYRGKGSYNDWAFDYLPPASTE